MITVAMVRPTSVPWTAPYSTHSRHSHISTNPCGENATSCVASATARHGQRAAPALTWCAPVVSV